jgi:GAF domain-containing protein
LPLRCSRGRTIEVQDYRPHVIAHGVTGSLSFPVVVDEETVAALNLYATTPHAFTPQDRERAATFAGEVSAALTLILRRTEEPMGRAHHARDGVVGADVDLEALGTVAMATFSGVAGSVRPLRFEDVWSDRSLYRRSAAVFTERHDLAPAPSPVSN